MIAEKIIAVYDILNPKAFSDTKSGDDSVGDNVYDNVYLLKCELESVRSSFFADSDDVSLYIVFWNERWYNDRTNKNDVHKRIFSSRFFSGYCSHIIP